jgi:hypothetical protein
MVRTIFLCGYFYRMIIIWVQGAVPEAFFNHVGGSQGFQQYPPC